MNLALVLVLVLYLSYKGRPVQFYIYEVSLLALISLQCVINNKKRNTSFIINLKVVKERIVFVTLFLLFVLLSCSLFQ